MTTADQAWPRYPLADLTRFVVGLFSATGMDMDKAEAVAASLIAADSMGHSTHGLALATWYLEAARSGVMATRGEMRVVNDRAGCITWDGQRLPGSWLISRAMDLALKRIEAQGVVTVEHVLGGGPELRLVRAAKTALNLVRLQLACTRPSPTTFSPVAAPPSATR